MPSDPERDRPPQTTDEYQSCPKCGCPHRGGVSVCSYCGSPLNAKTPMAERIRRAVETVKWRYKLKGGKARRGGGAASRLVTAALGAALFALGIWFIAEAAPSGNFSGFLIGALFLLYGVYSCAAALGRGKGPGASSR